MKDGDRFRIALSKFRGKNRKQFYPEIINLLTGYVQNHPDHLAAVRMLAFALAETGQFRDSHHYYQHVLRANKNDTEALNAVAFLELENGGTESSVNYLLDAIYVDDKNQRLKKNLESLKKIKDAKLFFSMTKPSDFIFIDLPKESYYSQLTGKLLELPSTTNGRIALAAAAVLIAIFLIYLVYPAYVSWMENYRFSRSIGSGKVTHITIQDVERLVQEREKYNLKLSEDQIREKFSMARTFLEEKRRNQAVILINELLNSNASDAIKERVGMLREFIPDPDPRQIDFNPDVREVIKTPFIYENVSLRWEGTAANLEHKARTETVFDLLIDFVDKATVQGIAETHFEGFKDIESGQKFTVFGIISGITVDNKVVVIGKEIQRIRR